MRPGHLTVNMLTPPPRPATMPSQAEAILPTQAQRRVGGGKAGHKATPSNGVARALGSARFQAFQANRAERPFASGHEQELSGAEPVLTSVSGSAPECSRKAALGSQRNSAEVKAQHSRSSGHVHV
jgi:hypothetical protein